MKIGLMLKIGAVVLLTVAIAQLYAWLQWDFIVLNPFVCTLFIVVSPFWYLMGVAADRDLKDD